MEIVKINAELCDGCGECVKVCAAEALSIEQGKAVVGPECFVCLACVVSCPTNAIAEPTFVTRGNLRAFEPPTVRSENPEFKPRTSFDDSVPRLARHGKWLRRLEATEKPQNEGGIVDSSGRGRSFYGCAKSGEGRGRGGGSGRR